MAERPDEHITDADFEVIRDPTAIYSLEGDLLPRRKRANSWPLPILLALALAGCGPTASEQVAACNIQGLKAFPAGPDEQTRWITRLCMQQHGYEWQPNDTYCSQVTFMQSYDANCYSRTSILDRLRPDAK